MNFLNTELFLKSLFLLLSESRKKCLFPNNSHSCRNCQLLKSDKLGTCLIHDIYKLSKDCCIKL